MLCLKVDVGAWLDMELTQDLPAGTMMRLFVIDKSNKVHRGMRLGIEAPKSVHILRSDAIETEAKSERH